MTIWLAIFIHITTNAMAVLTVFAALAGQG